jgi:hypothetical protein
LIAVGRASCPKPLAVDLGDELMEKCERCGGEIIGTSGYGAVHGFTLLSLNYFYLCKNCSRELDEVAKANPEEVRFELEETKRRAQLQLQALQHV